MLQSLLIILSFILLSIICKKISRKNNGCLFLVVGSIASIFIIVICLVVYSTNTADPKPKKTETISSGNPFTSDAYIQYYNSQNDSSVSSYYQSNYPMTWGYIYKNADDPYEYIEFYDDVWGDMQKYTGDGINFDTLTRYEQSLVNYPRIGSYVYFASSSSKEYHSTKQCYSLLKSNPVSRPASHRHNYNPCSKCVKQ